MTTKTLNNNSNYTNQIKLNLEKLKNNQIQHVKVDLTKINIKTLASQIGVLSEDVKLIMKLLTSERYYALNDRTIALLMKGDIDTSVIVDVEVIGMRESDAEVKAIIEHETKVEIFIVDKNKTRAGGAFFPFLNNTIFDLSKYGIFKKVDRNNYKHNCLYLALKAGGSFFPYLNITIFDLSKYGIFKSVDKNNYKHNCLYLAYKLVDYQILDYKN